MHAKSSGRRAAGKRPPLPPGPEQQDVPGECGPGLLDADVPLPGEDELLTAIDLETRALLDRIDARLHRLTIQYLPARYRYRAALQRLSQGGGA